MLQILMYGNWPYQIIDLVGTDILISNNRNINENINKTINF